MMEGESISPRLSSGLHTLTLAHTHRIPAKKRVEGSWSNSSGLRALAASAVAGLRPAPVRPEPSVTPVPWNPYQICMWGITYMQVEILMHINKSKNTKQKQNTEKEESNYQKQGENKGYGLLEH